MKIIAPTCLKLIKTKDLIPIKLYEGNGVIIQIDEMSSEEIEDFFSIKGLIINRDLDSLQMEYILHIDDLTDHREKIMAKYKVVIDQNSNDITEGRNLVSHLDLIFRSVIGDNIGIYKFQDTGSIPNSFLHTGKKGHFSNLKTEITEKELGGIKKGIERILAEKIDNTFLQKISLLKTLLEYSMSAEDYSGPRGSFIVSILESLYVPEHASEIGFRMSTRIVKKNKLDFESFGKLNKIYNHRSIFFHTGKNSFKKEDFTIIQDLAQNSILDYIMNPEQFKQDELNKILLN